MSNTYNSYLDPYSKPQVDQVRGTTTSDKPDVQKPCGPCMERCVKQQGSTDEFTINTCAYQCAKIVGSTLEECKKY